MGLGFEAPVAFDAFVLFDFKLVVTPVAALCFGEGGRCFVAGLHFGGCGSLLKRQGGHGVAGELIHGLGASDSAGCLDLNTRCAAVGSH